ncbi:MAG: hypothetical protein FWH22_04220, partial [Fibromonadales bacterium]|nr:hypothetical protein [Fibromonadales bacterium]
MKKVLFSFLLLWLVASCANKPQETKLIINDPCIKPKYYIPEYARNLAMQRKEEYLNKNQNKIEDFKYRFFYDDSGHGQLQYKITPLDYRINEIIHDG